jgi:hypothetical protein
MRRVSRWADPRLIVVGVVLLVPLLISLPYLISTSHTSSVLEKSGVSVIGRYEGPCQESNGHISNLCEVNFNLHGKSYSEYVDLTELGTTPTKGMKITLSVLPSDPSVLEIPQANGSTLGWVAQTAGWIAAGIVVLLVVRWRRRIAGTAAASDPTSPPNNPIHP